MKPYFLSAVLFLLYAPVILTSQPPISGGWSQFMPASDSRIIYVSDITGDDATAQTYTPVHVSVGADPFYPTGPILPFKTIHAARAYLRPGYPDYLLFSRGETWDGQSLGSISLYGRSRDEMMVIGTYGAAASRPVINTGSMGFVDLTGISASHLAFIGLELRPLERSGEDEPVGIRIINAPFDNILIEDCLLAEYFQHLSVHDPGGAVVPTRSGLRVRRCVFRDAYATSSAHANAMYIDNVDTVFFEDNLMDHNGWHTGIPGANPTGFRHNSYFQVHNDNLTFRNNIVARAGATGGGHRCGGLVYNNLYLSNPKNLQFGTHETTIGWPAEARSGEISYNVILDSRTEPFEQGSGIHIQRVRDAAVHHNIIAHYTPVSGYNNAILINEAENVDLHHNIIYNWGNNSPSGPAYSGGFVAGGSLAGSNTFSENDIQMKNSKGYCVIQNGSFSTVSYTNNRYFNINDTGHWFDPGGSYAGWLSQSGETGSSNTEVAYTDPGRNISTYLLSVGQSGGLDEFLESRSNLSRENWDDRYTAATVNDYIRQGFDQSILLSAGRITATVRNTDKGNEIAWTAEAPGDISGFEVQWSVGAAGFYPVTFLTAHEGIKNYKYLHKKIHRENYYRIRTIRKNGSEAYSGILHQVNPQTDIKLFPNPAEDMLRIEHDFQDLGCCVHNITGQVILSEKSFRAPLKINTSGLSPGIYFLKCATDNNLIFTSKFIKK